MSFIDNGCWSTQPSLDCVIPRQVGLGYVTTVASQSEQASTQCPSWSLLHASRFFLELLLWIPLLMGRTLSSEITPLPRADFGQHFITVIETKHKAAFDKILHFFVINTLKILGVEKVVSKHNEGYI